MPVTIRILTFHISKSGPAMRDGKILCPDFCGLIWSNLSTRSSVFIWVHRLAFGFRIRMIDAEGGCKSQQKKGWKNDITKSHPQNDMPFNSTNYSDQTAKVSRGVASKGIRTPKWRRNSIQLKDLWNINLPRCHQICSVTPWAKHYPDE